MSFECYSKYYGYKRRPSFPTINSAVVIFMGLTIEDLGIGVVTFLVFAMALGSPFVGILAGSALSYLRRLYTKRFPRGTLVQTLWSRGILTKKYVPSFFRTQQNPVFSP